jgi:hypothetical protein
MAFWWLDRCLPGIVASLIVTVPVWVSHILLRRHVTRTTERQNAHIEKLTTDQTAALNRSKEGEAG